ncbi:putative E3 ubiquitin-protein ligase SINA-like 6 [Mercurialis annua]|uniref:putative E3 ubiquitin-protein ligase SINA-like 6 n=1 Tax=Mercurialis annua TaxID=3986 RepID=UPI0021608FF6|nr:putative E3 ubiquitin-protein ligase SINA-like 6 [Mercurialis annua]
MDPSSSNSNVGQSRSDNSVSSFDLELLDCSICYEPLTIPITQCVNGHTTCSTCSDKLEKCPYCELPIGAIRNLAFEKIIQSVKFNCRYKSCPVVGSSEIIYAHYKMMHNYFVTNFDYDSNFVVSLRVDSESFVVLQENKSIDVFVLNNKSESLRNVLTLWRLGLSSRSHCHYVIEIKFSDSCIKFESIADNIQSVETYTNYLLGLFVDRNHTSVADCFTNLVIIVYADTSMLPDPLQDDSDFDIWNHK